MKKNVLFLVLVCFLNLPSWGTVSEASVFVKATIPSFSNDSSLNEVFDYNNDGFMDVVVCDYGAAKLTVLLNDKSGGFNELCSIPFSLSKGMVHLMSGDFDNDSYSDILISNYEYESLNVLVYKNFNGESLSLFYNYQDTLFNDYGTDGAVFLDIDLDNDLDIISKSKVILFNGTRFFEPKEVMNLPDLRYFEGLYSNPVALGQINVVNQFLYLPYNKRLTIGGNISSDSIFEFTYNVGGTSGYNTFDASAIMLDLNGDLLVDRLCLQLVNEKLVFKYYNYLEYDLYHDLGCIDFSYSNIGEFKWDIGDLNGDGVVDICYAYLYENQIRVGVKYLVKDENNNLILDHGSDTILTDKPEEYIKQSWFLFSLKLADMDNDHDLDVVVANTIYYN